MGTVIFWGLIGLLVGWATPQPGWAVVLTDWTIMQFGRLKEVFNSKSEL